MRNAALLNIKKGCEKKLQGMKMVIFHLWSQISQKGASLYMLKNISRALESLHSTLKIKFHHIMFGPHFRISKHETDFNL